MKFDKKRNLMETSCIKHMYLNLHEHMNPHIHSSPSANAKTINFFPATMLIVHKGRLKKLGIPPKTKTVTAHFATHKYV